MNWAGASPLDCNYQLKKYSMTVMEVIPLNTRPDRIPKTIAGQMVGPFFFATQRAIAPAKCQAGQNAWQSCGKDKYQFYDIWTASSSELCRGGPDE